MGDLSLPFGCYREIVALVAMAILAVAWREPERRGRGEWRVRAGGAAVAFSSAVLTGGVGACWFCLNNGGGPRVLLAPRRCSA